MIRRRSFLIASTVLSILALAVPAGAAETTRTAPAHVAHPRPYTFAVIGDVPYGDAQVAGFDRVVDQINADPDVALVDHLGDIKNGSSVCSDSYFATIRSDFDRFRDPLVYTPGDNEWTDCHRPNNGGYNPLERLTAVRQQFFPRPGHTLGQRRRPVRSQAGAGYPENVTYRRAGVSFGAVHIVGSNNGLQPWTGRTAPTPEQTAEVLGRTAADVALITRTFRIARRHSDRAVVLLTQADMFDPTVKAPAYADYYAYQPLVDTLAREARSFRGPVYLFNGDSHVYNSDRPLGSTSPWRAFYGVAQPANNLRRITVDGSDQADNYLKVTVHPHRREVLSWVRVPFVAR